MTTIELADLFTPALRRERVIDWQAPGPAAKAAAAMSGLEAMRAIRDGILPEPPMARLIDFRLRVAEPGRIVMELEPHESLENTIGLLHGATAAALLDRHGLRCHDHAASRAGFGHPRPETHFFATAVGEVGHHLGRGKADKTGPPDQLCRRFCARRVGQSCGARDRDLFDDRRGAANEIDAAFFGRNCYW
jgi:hypothetical protein